MDKPPLQRNARWSSLTNVYRTSWTPPAHNPAAERGGYLCVLVDVIVFRTSVATVSVFVRFVAGACASRPRGVLAAAAPGAACADA